MHSPVQHVGEQSQGNGSRRESNHFEEVGQVRFRAETVSRKDPKVSLTAYEGRSADLEKGKKRHPISATLAGVGNGSLSSGWRLEGPGRKNISNSRRRIDLSRSSSNATVTNSTFLFVNWPEFFCCRSDSGCRYQRCPSRNFRNLYCSLQDDTPSDLVRVPSGKLAKNHPQHSICCERLRDAKVVPRRNVL